MTTGTVEIRLYLCPDCGNYEPLDGGGDFLKGTCDACHKGCPEVHVFGLAVDITMLAACECSGSHPRRETV